MHRWLPRSCYNPTNDFLPEQQPSRRTTFFLSQFAKVELLLTTTTTNTTPTINITARPPWTPVHHQHCPPTADGAPTPVSSLHPQQNSFKLYKKILPSAVHFAFFPLSSWFFPHKDNRILKIGEFEEITRLIFILKGSRL